MIYAFDFDGTLSNEALQTLALKLRKEKNVIWVVTMRKDNEFNRKILKPVLDKMFLTDFNVLYCNDKPKWELLKIISADIYIDNINDEFETILNYTNTIPLLF